MRKSQLGALVASDRRVDKMKKVLLFTTAFLLTPIVAIIGKVYYGFIYDLIYQGDSDAKRLAAREEKRNQIYSIKKRSEHYRQMVSADLNNKLREATNRLDKEQEALMALGQMALAGLTQMQSDVESGSDDSEASEVFKNIVTQQHLGYQED